MTAGRKKKRTKKNLPSRTTVRQSGLGYTARGLPDFALAPVRRSSPDSILSPTGKHPLDEFVLMLAVAFNDLKDMAWLYDRSVSAGLHYRAMTGKAGQAAGMQWHAVRQMIAIGHEILNLVGKNASVLESAEFGVLLDRLPAQVRRDWKTVVDVSRAPLGTEQGTPRSFRSWLMLMRNHTVSHYAQPKYVVDGYRRFFYEDSPSPQNEYACFSEGVNMEETRFYFADAAALAALRRFGNSFQSRLRDFSRQLNVALKHLVTEYARERTGSSPAD